MVYDLRWTDESVENLGDILEYLKNKFTSREVKSFKIKLTRLLKLIRQNPYLFQNLILIPS